MAAEFLTHGTYVIKNAAYQDRVIDVRDARSEPNTPIIGYSYHKGENQQWEVEQFPGNVYQLRSKLNTTGATPIFFAQSILRVYPPLIATQPYGQQWSIEPVGDGLFRIHFPYMDGVATLPDEKEKTQLIIEPWEGRESQKWRFENV
ncbi:RICIN domain-containing protein [Streptomyces melanogenes]|uniref:RICIN domain-containing protein n=1 Tax=Streptomyces melanogenes TaxID=67326 RepID=A0ABZ1XPJ2_9ACTN|nr:RICIN domain-containing protein [Streptomyces melanogenes]